MDIERNVIDFWKSNSSEVAQLSVEEAAVSKVPLLKLSIELHSNRAFHVDRVSFDRRGKLFHKISVESASERRTLH